MNETYRNTAECRGEQNKSKVWKGAVSAAQEKKK